MGRSEPSNAAAWIAATCAAWMIAWQVGVKATRDALFLSHYDVTLLPRMVIVSAILSIALIPALTRLMTRLSPARLMPWVYLLSAASMAGTWALYLSRPRIASVLLYVVVAALGAVLISGFWSVVNETFDPRSGKRYFTRITWGATLGGLVGGLVADRVAVHLSVAAFLPVLAAMHLVCAALIARLGRAEARTAPAPASKAQRSALGLLWSRPYLRHLATLVVLLTVTGGLVDYVFKAEVVELYQDAALMRFFAWFYMGTGLVTFLVQVTVAGPLLGRLGLGRTMAVLPATIALGGVGCIVAPGVGSAVALRATDNVLRHSTYRSAYELLYVPLGRNEKRRTKSIIDVGFGRVGDVVGGVVVSGVLLLGVAVAPVLLGLVVALSALAVLVTWVLKRGYITALERSLVSQAADHDLLDEVEDGATRSVLLRTLGATQLTRLDPRLSQAVFSADLSPRRPEPTPAPPARARAPEREDAVVRRVADLRSGDLARVEEALAADLVPELVGHVIPLLAWDAAALAAAAALEATNPRSTGQLVDALTDPGEEFAIRRRLPRALSARGGERAVRGLLAGLADRRFEVRYRCGRALVRLRREAPEVPIDPDAVRRAVVREVSTERGVWMSRRLLDEDDDLADDLLRDRSNRSLEHVFSLLSLFLPSEPLTIAFRGLHTDDPYLVGTALEYLEQVLPADIREPMWPFLDPKARPAAPDLPDDEVLDRLLKSHHSIQLNLAEIRKRLGEDDSTP